MSFVDLIKNAILAAIGYRVAVKLWRNIQKSRGAVTPEERRLATLWRWQAFGLAVAAIPILTLWLLHSFVDERYVPFWTVYAVVITVGAGALVFTRAKNLESQSVVKPQLVDRASSASRPFEIGWKVALILSFSAFFASLSLSSIRPYQWLAQPLMVVTYVALSLAFLLALLVGWARGRSSDGPPR
jgi:hypothetical protein